MELPKNLVQMGKPDKSHKIFIEDYIMSYIKEWNRSCEGQSTGLAFYGKSVKEGGCTYYFLYGASRIEGLTKRGAFLSQLDREEIDTIGKRFFPEYDFLVWSTVADYLPETLYVDTHGKGIEVSGYACFYEKNETMLNFMLSMEECGKKADTYVRGTWDAGSVREEKKDPVSETATENSNSEKKQNRNRQMQKYLRGMKLASAAIFVVLCVIGITVVNDFDKMEDLQVAAGQVIAELSSQKIPDAMGSTENVNYGNSQDEENTETTEYGNSRDEGNLKTTEYGNSRDEENMKYVEEGRITENTEETKEDDTPVQGPAITKDVEEPTSYTIMRGDTLNAICRRKYGSLGMVQKVCELNGIQNPDNIEVGQTILLP